MSFRKKKNFLGSVSGIRYGGIPYGTYQQPKVGGIVLPLGMGVFLSVQSKDLDNAIPSLTCSFQGTYWKCLDIVCDSQ